MRHILITCLYELTRLALKAAALPTNETGGQTRAQQNMHVGEKTRKIGSCKRRGRWWGDIAFLHPWEYFLGPPLSSRSTTRGRCSPRNSCLSAKATVAAVVVASEFDPGENSCSNRTWTFGIVFTCGWQQRQSSVWYYLQGLDDVLLTHIDIDQHLLYFHCSDRTE